MSRPGVSGGRPRVVLVAPRFPQLSETFVVRQFVGLLDRGWDVHVVCGDSPEEEWQAFPLLARRADARRRVHVEPPTESRW